MSDTRTVTRSHLRDDKCWTHHDPNCDRCTRYWLHSDAALPQPAPAADGVPRTADLTLCDCGHTAHEHTDRGEQDAGLCLHRGCDCDEFVEAEAAQPAPGLDRDELVEIIEQAFFEDGVALTSAMLAADRILARLRGGDRG
jgi:hypothetical protein